MPIVLKHTKLNPIMVENTLLIYKLVSGVIYVFYGRPLEIKLTFQLFGQNTGSSIIVRSIFYNPQLSLT